MIYYTSVTACFIPKARVLGKSLKKYNPDAKFYLLLSDKIPANFNLENEPFDGIIRSDEIVLECGMSVPFWFYLHDVTELCTAVKGWAALELLKRTGEDKIVYLDPDIAVFHSLKPLEQMLDQHDIIITPHRLAPEPRFDDCFYGDPQLYTRGVFNLGFLAVRATEQGIRFLQWWRKSLETLCYVDDPNGLFTDQKLIDLAPAFFDKLYICRDEGYNITQRTISGTPEDLRANGKPVYFYHFSNYDSGLHKSVIEDHCNDNKALWELYNWYTAQQEQNGYYEMRKIRCQYDAYDNGEKITHRAREMSRKRSDIIEKYALSDPYVTNGEDTLYNYYKLYFPEYLTDEPIQPQNTEQQLYLEYQKVLASHSYRIGHALVQTVNGILPVGSRRRRALGGLRRFLAKLRYGVRSFVKKEGPDSYWQRRRDKKNKDDSTIIPEKYLLATPQKPLCSVIVWDAEYFGNIYRCMQSIVCNNDKSMNFEVLVSGPLSAVVKQKLERSFVGLQILEDEGLASLLNRAKGRYAVVLSETVQTPNDFLRDAIRWMREKKAGIITPMIHTADERLLEAGGVMLQDGRRVSYGQGDDIHKARYTYVKEVDCASPKGFVVDMDQYRTHTVDEDFGPLYQVADLSFSLRKRSFPTFYIPRLFLLDMQPQQESCFRTAPQDAERFAQKWGEVLKRENIADESEMFWGRDRSKGKKTIFVVDDRVPVYDMSAGDRTTFQYLQVLAEMGYNVKDVGDEMRRREPYAGQVEDMGIELIGVDGRGDVEWQEFLRDNGTFVDVAYINRPHNLEKYYKDLRRYTNAKIVYYCMDLHFLREKREYTLKNDVQNLKRIAKMEKEEIAVTDLADVAFTLSTYEKEVLEKRLTHAQVVLNPIFIYREFPQVNLNFDERKDLIFVGGFAHTPNIDAVKWFCNRILPQIVEKIPNIKIHVVGSNPTNEIQRMASSHVVIEGYLSDSELQQLYSQCRMCVIPLRYGAGIKGKVLEAMYYGLPVVSTSIGTEGIVNIDECIESVDDAQEFAEKVVALYQDADKLQQMSMANQQYVKDHLGVEPAKNLFKKVF